MKRYLPCIAVVIFVTTPLLSLAQTAPLVSTACTDFTINLSAGHPNDLNVAVQVLNLQLALSKEGFPVDPGEFGTFGVSTKAGIKLFQEKYSDDILAPFGLKQGTGYFGTNTRLKMQAFYGCRKIAAPPNIKVNLAVTNLTLDGSGITATVCNRGNNLPTAPFRIRLNGINRDFEAVGAQKAGSCVTDTWKYETWGLTFDPGTTFTAVALVDPLGFYKSSQLEYPTNYQSSYIVPSLPGAHLAVRGILLKSTGLQAIFCNLGTVNLTSFPVRITVNSSTDDFDVPEVYQAGKCYSKQWTFDKWGISYKSGVIYNATVKVDPDNTYVETNKFDNVASVVGIP